MFGVGDARYFQLHYQVDEIRTPTEITTYPGYLGIDKIVKIGAGMIHSIMISGIHMIVLLLHPEMNQILEVCLQWVYVISMFLDE